jgi:hypothetical protein
MNEFIKWQNVKNSMTAFSIEERIRIDLLTDIIAIIIKRKQELGISQRKLENQKTH